MGLFDNITKPPKLRICMFGPRGVGKTTVMTSIFKDSQNGVSGSQIYMNSGNAECSMLIEYADKLSKAIEERNPGKLPATNTPADYLFNLGLIGKRPTVQLQIKDFPGEYLARDARPEHKTEVREYVENSNIILVAVDSPYVMELGGAYNEMKNDPEQVIHYFQENPEAFRNKLVLFIPLKCESYFYDGRMADLADKVKAMYAPLKPYFLTNNIASAIVPVLTLGGMVYDHMDDANIGGVATKIARYDIYNPAPKYAPLFCAQPIYYLLTYVAVHYEWLKNNASVFERLKNILFSYLTKDDEFRREIFKMRRNIITDKIGFEMLTSNSIFKL